MGTLYKKSLRYQLGFIIVSVATLLLAAFGWQTIHSKANVLEHELMNSLKSKINYLSIALQVPVYNFDDVTQKALCTSFLADPDIIQVTLHSNNKTKQYGDKNIDKEVIRLKRTIAFNDETIGYIEIVTSTKKLKQQIKAVTIRIIILI